MPKTKFQDIIFTIMMFLVMVYAMVVYNISLDMGKLTNQVFLMAFAELPIMGIVGFILEMFIAGPLSKKLAFRIVNPAENKLIFVILAISAFTVCLMCPMMSLVATILFKGGLHPELLSSWLQTTALNFPMALCWQIFCAGPLVRCIFRVLFPEKETAREKAAEAA